MDTKRFSKCCTGRTAASSLLACVGAGAILLTAALALAQEGANSGTRASAEKPGFFGAIVRWFDDQTSKFGTDLMGASSSVENFGHEAGIAAKTTVEGAKDAAGAVTRIPPPAWSPVTRNARSHRTARPTAWSRPMPSAR